MAILSWVGGKNIEYFECPKSPTESFSFQGGGRVSRTFLVKWEDRWAFVTRMLGWSQVLCNKDNKMYISRSVPVGYREIVPNNRMGDDSENYWLFPTQVERIEGVAEKTKNEVTDVYKYQKARITLNYETLTYRVRTDEDMPQDSSGNPDESTLKRFVTRHIQPTSEYLTLPFGQLKYTSDEQVAVNGIGRLVPTAEIQYTWHQVPVVPNAVYTHIGRINNADFPDQSVALNPGGGCSVPISHYKFPKGTLLLTSAEIKSYRTIGGLFVCDILYRMKYFSAINPSTGDAYTPARGHNFILRYKTKGINTTSEFPNGKNPYTGSYQQVPYYDYERVTSTGNIQGNGIYPEADFSLLFKPV